MSKDTLCPKLPLMKKGKIREIYDLGDSLLLVATDKISAFDVVLSDTIENKGRLLTQLSNFWFSFFEKEVENHVIATEVKDFPAACQEYAKQLEGRAILVKKLEILPVEAIVRGYITGSGWKDYQKSGAISGVTLPAGLQESGKFAEAIFTPSTKATEGHDENISEKELHKIIKPEILDEVKRLSLLLYTKAAEYAREKGIIIADTKFEFGLLDGKVVLADEVLTPDSSRFWDASKYAIGQSQESYDKQIIRDYLASLDWDKTPPAPVIPQAILQKTSDKYKEVYQLLTK